MLASHGRSKIKVVNNVLIQWFADSWNEEAIIEHIKKFKVAAKPLTSGEWAIISIFDQWELGIPAIEPHVTEACVWFKQHGCIRDCHVYKSNSTKKVQLEKMISSSEGDYQRQVFSNLSDAIAWLETQGFPIKDTKLLEETRTFESQHR